MTKQKTPKNAEYFYCSLCDFKCSKQSDYNRHLTTAKHQIRTNTKQESPKNAKAYKEYKCDCGKEYKHASSLWNHKTKCISVNSQPENQPSTLMMLRKETDVDYKD